MFRFLAFLTSASLLLVSCGVAPNQLDLVSTAPPVAESTPQPPKTLDLKLLERMVILGSSASDGFNIQLETGAPTRLADYFEAGLLVDHKVVYDGATSSTFLNPEVIAGAATKKALAEDPTLVVAVDFLFWFFYGSGGPDNTNGYRLGRLETGLALLDSFKCTVLVGDLPNMSGAAGGMIPMASMPAAASFINANKRIAEWAAERPNIVIVPLADFNEKVASGQPFAVGEFIWDPAVSGDLLQFDRLHPNLAGEAVLALQILRSLAESRAETLDGIAIQDPEDLADAVDDLILER